MNPFDQFFGEGSWHQAVAAEDASKREAAEWACKPYTACGMLKSSKMSRGSTGNLSIEMSELSGMGWHRLDPPATITVTWDEDRRHVYRRRLIDRTPDGDVGAWIYVPGCPDVAPAPEVHIFND